MIWTKRFRNKHEENKKWKDPSIKVKVEPSKSKFSDIKKSYSYIGSANYNIAPLPPSSWINSPKKEEQKDDFGRSYYKCDNLEQYGGNKNYEEVSYAQDANLISSKLANGNHAPTLDIDLPCKLWESSTPGHHHLTIDKELSWEQYEMLLIVLGECGILEPNYVTHSLRSGQTFLRKPGVKKENITHVDYFPF